MPKFFSVFISCVLFVFVCNGQSATGIATGISRDINNANQKFYHIPVSLELIGVEGRKKRTAPIIKINYDIPFAAKAIDYAYTLNSSLPASIPLQKKINAYIFNIGMVIRIKLFQTIQHNKFYLDLMPLGYSSQNIKVEYPKYDKNNYSILNPDESLDVSGFSIGAGLAYSVPFKKNNLMIALFIQSAPAAKTGDYPLSYQLLAPLQFTIGYNFLSKKK